MTLAEIKTMLDGAKMPVAYLAFPADECPAMPFITFQETGSSNFGADGKVFQPIRNIQIDLFTKDKNPDAEEALETVLNNAEIFWNKFQTIEDNESCQRYTYEISVIGG